MKAHTRGPWRVGNLASYDGCTGQPYRNIWAGEDEDATVVARAIRSEGAMSNDVDADAHLIAAAPDLLEACKQWISERENPVPCWVMKQDAERKMRSAIAKAEAKT